MRSAVLVLALGACACSRGGGENLGLGEAPGGRAAIDPAALTRIDVLLQALRLPAGELDRRLGARGVEASSSIKIEPPGKPAEQLDETFTLDSDGRGAWHLEHDNARGYGVEATALGGALYIRPRYGQLIKRRPEPEELAQLRASVEGVAADYLAIVARQAQVREAGALEIAGHQGIKLALSAAAQPSGGAGESDPARRWRDTVRATYLDGELVLDAASGALLQARIAAAYTFEREGTKGPLAVTLTYKLATGAPKPIAEPAGAVASPERTRPMVDRQALLDGLKERPRARRTHD